MFAKIRKIGKRGKGIAENWENLFWMSEFSHLGANAFDYDELIPMNKKLKDILV